MWPLVDFESHDLATWSPYRKHRLPPTAAQFKLINYRICQATSLLQITQHVDAFGAVQLLLKATQHLFWRFDRLLSRLDCREFFRWSFPSI